MTYKTTRKCCYAGYIAQAVSINLAPLLFIIFRKSFGISYALLGLLTLINFLTQLIVDVLSAAFLDKISYRTSAVTSQLFCAVGLILLPALAQLEHHYLGLCLATVIYSIGAGLIEVVINPIMTAVPDDEGGGSLILLHSFYCWGQLAVVFITTAVIALFGEASWYIIAPCWGLLPLANAFFFVETPIVEPGSDKPQPEEKSEKEEPKKELFCRRFMLILVLMVCAGASEQPMAQWSSIFAQEALGVSKFIGDLLGPSLFALFMGIGRTIHGIYGERLNFKLHVYINSLLCVLCYMAASLLKNPYAALMGCALCGYAISVMWPGIVSLAAEKFPNGGGAMYGAIAMAGDIGCSAAPYITGVVASMKVWGDNGLKAGMFVSIVYPIVYAAAFTAFAACGRNGKRS